MSSFLGRVIETTVVHLTAGVTARLAERGMEVVQEKFLTVRGKRSKKTDDDLFPSASAEEAMEVIKSEKKGKL